MSNPLTDNDIYGYPVVDQFNIFRNDLTLNNVKTAVYDLGLSFIIFEYVERTKLISKTEDARWESVTTLDKFEKEPERWYFRLRRRI